jgi:hypothetical protein
MELKGLLPVPKKKPVQSILHVQCLISEDMELYIDQRIAQVLNLFIYLILPYMFRVFF